MRKLCLSYPVILVFLGLGVGYWSVSWAEAAHDQHKVVDRIRSEIKGFDRLNGFERVEKIREWVYRQTDEAASESFLLTYDAYPLSEC